MGWRKWRSGKERKSKGKYDGARLNSVYIGTRKRMIFYSVQRERGDVRDTAKAISQPTPVPQENTERRAKSDQTGREWTLCR